MCTSARHSLHELIPWLMLSYTLTIIMISIIGCVVSILTPTRRAAMVLKKITIIGLFGTNVCSGLLIVVLFHSSSEKIISGGVISPWRIPITTVSSATKGSRIYKLCSFTCQRSRWKSNGKGRKLETKSKFF